MNISIDEREIQRVFRGWCCKQDFILTHWHVPNGMASNPKEGRKMKLDGMLAGVWDYWLILTNGKTLVIEFKTVKGRLSEEQIEFEKALTVAKIPHKVCRGSHEAVLFVKENI